MRRPRSAHAIRAMVLVAAITADALVASGAHAAPVVVVPGWTVKSFAVLPLSASPEGIGVDGQGSIYVCDGLHGIFRIDTSGAYSVWSNAPGYGLAVLPDGEAYVPSVDLFATKYIWHVAADGSYAPLASKAAGEGWVWAAVTASGKLFVNNLDTLSSIDIATGRVTTLVGGGPGIDGSGVWYGMASDGETVYAATASEGTLSNYAVYGWNGATLDLVAATPNIWDVCIGPDGIYASSGPTGPRIGAVYKVTASPDYSRRTVNAKASAW